MKHFNIIVAIIAVAAVIFLMARGIYKQSEEKNELANTTQASILEIKNNDWVSGNPEAPVTLIEYLDFECETCGAYYPLVSQLKTDYQDQMRFAVRYFPLPGHKNSRSAAHAVEAAGKQGKFWEMHDMLFTRQREWGEQHAADQDQFEKYAREIGLNIDQWKQDVASTEVKDRVDANYQEAIQLGLQGTPSFFLNGRKIEGPRTYEGFKRLIDATLQE
ncbi:MAG: DsbA family protein [Candidatus Buchananbacteria bacterium]|nr:DsbA family protein [Candidatus Buchananbacteria bacterium]